MVNNIRDVISDLAEDLSAKEEEKIGELVKSAAKKLDNQQKEKTNPSVRYAEGEPNDAGLMAEMIGETEIAKDLYDKPKAVRPSVLKDERGQAHMRRLDAKKVDLRTFDPTKTYSGFDNVLKESLKDESPELVDKILGIVEKMNDRKQDNYDDTKNKEFFEKLREFDDELNEALKNGTPEDVAKIRAAEAEFSDNWVRIDTGDLDDSLDTKSVNKTDTPLTNRPTIKNSVKDPETGVTKMAHSINTPLAKPNKSADKNLLDFISEIEDKVAKSYKLKMTIDLNHKLLIKTLEGAHKKLDELSSDDLLLLINPQVDSLFDKVFTDRKH